MSEPQEPTNLPLEVVDREDSSTAQSPWRRLLILPIVGVLVLTGGVIGLYFQPPGVKLVMNTLGLAPGGGTQTPIALPIESKARAAEAKPAAVGAVAGLGKLIPRGDVISLAPPFGAGDARISEIRVEIGGRVKEGEILVVLDNESTLLEAVEVAKANLAVRDASLSQSRQSTQASKVEAKAALERAKAAAVAAKTEYKRGISLFDKAAISQSTLDQLKSTSSQADSEVVRLEAVLSRFKGSSETQADVVVSKRSLQAAEVELTRAKSELERAYIRAPLTATVLDISNRPGERPGADGVLELGDLDQMVAEVEVYQSLIGRVKVGQPVELVADALSASLKGTVRSLGLSVGRQTLVGTDPAANTDARVVKVYVDLDEASTEEAARFTNLQVVAHIDVGASK